MVSRYQLVVAEEVVPYIMVCVDSAGWHNGARPGGALTCAMYVERGYCAGGRMTQHWTNGAAFRWPSRHCCACGKNASSPQLGLEVPPSLRLDQSARHTRDAWVALFDGDSVVEMSLDIEYRAAQGRG